MTITTATDPWIEAHINAGHLSPGARGLTRDEAAHQYNQSNALDPSDPDYLYTPERAQAAAHDALRFVDIDVPDHREIRLTDLAAGPRAGRYAVTPTQVEAACEQFRLVTGDAISADAIIAALPWT